jgi:hypothetical protein
MSSLEEPAWVALLGAKWRWNVARRALAFPDVGLQMTRAIGWLRRGRPPVDDGKAVERIVRIRSRGLAAIQGSRSRMLYQDFSISSLYMRVVQ